MVGAASEENKVLHHAFDEQHLPSLRRGQGGHKEMSSILATNSALVYEPKCGERGGGEVWGLSQ
jgi:hypothetical protein